jgi:hypothetical protein
VFIIEHQHHQINLKNDEWSIDMLLVVEIDILKCRQTEPIGEH